MANISLSQWKQMDSMVRLCREDIEKLSLNLTKFLCHIETYKYEFVPHFDEVQVNDSNMIAVKNFQSYIQKINILAINMNSEIELQTKFIKETALFTKNINIAKQNKMEVGSKNVDKIVPGASILYQSEVLPPDIKFPIDFANIKVNVEIMQRSLSQFFEGKIFYGTITHIEDYSKGIFYIQSSDQKRLLPEDKRDISKIDFSKNFHIGELVGKIIAISINNKQPVRAIVMPKLYENYFKAFLMDYGKTVPITDSHEFFEIPIEYQIIPAQLIKCSFYSRAPWNSNNLFINNFKDDTEGLFKIIKIIGYVLYVELLKLCIKNPINSHIKIENKEKNNFTASPLRLYNSQKTKESSRLCSPVSLSKEKPIENAKIIQNNNILQIRIKHIVSAVDFYGIIITGDEAQEICWSLITKHNELLKNEPKVGDIVLAQTNNKLWYRVKIIKIKKDITKVFLIDIGNMLYLQWKGLRACSKEQIKMKCSISRFQLADYFDVSKENGLHGSCIQLLSNLVLYKDILVKVVKKNNMILIRLVDIELISAFEELIKMGCLIQMNDSKIK